MDKINKKWKALVIEHLYYPLFLALLSFILASSYIDSSFEHSINALNASVYGQGSSNKVTVLYMDDAFLDDLRMSRFLGEGYVNWPLPYKTQAAIYNRLLKYRPKAIFIDLAYFNQREENQQLAYLSEDFLNNAKRIRKNKAEIPVFLAALQYTQKGGGKAVRLPISAFNNHATPVLAGWDSIPSGRYPLVMDIDGKSYPSAAFALYQAYCLPDCPKGLQNLQLDESMAIQWPDRTTRYLIHTKEPSETTGCVTSSRHFLMEKFSSKLRGEVFATFKKIAQALGDKSNEIPVQGQLLCPPVDTVHASFLIDPNSHRYKKALESLFKDRIVLIGASVSGSEDLTLTPTHAFQPGVYRHAMALDNLLTYGKDYKRDVVFNSKVNLFDIALIEFGMLIILGFIRLVMLKMKEAEYKTNIGIQHFSDDKERFERDVVNIELYVLLISTAFIMVGLLLVRKNYPDISMLGLTIVGTAYTTMMLSLAPRFLKKSCVWILHHWFSALIGVVSAFMIVLFLDYIFFFFMSPVNGVLNLY